MKYIRGLDGLRAYSIILVLVTHLGVWDNLPSGSFLYMVAPVFSHSTGVYIFFAISGFLITDLLRKEKVGRGRINFKNFYIRRFLRLVPPIIIFYCIVFYLMVSGNLDTNFTALLLSIFYLYNFAPIKFNTPELGHTWSLGVEEQFYLFWPFVINIGRKGIIILISFSILCICVLITPYLGQFEVQWGSKSWQLSQLFRDTSRLFLPAIAPIMIGAICAYVRNLHFFKSRSGAIILLLSSIFFFFSQLLVPEAFFYIISDSITKGIGTGLLLIYLFWNQQGLLTRLLELGPIRYLGRISYGIYIWQGLFLRNGPGGLLLIQSFPLNLILSILVPIISFEFMERRFLRYKNRFR